MYLVKVFVAVVFTLEVTLLLSAETRSLVSHSTAAVTTAGLLILISAGSLFVVLLTSAPMKLQPCFSCAWPELQPPEGTRTAAAEPLCRLQCSSTMHSSVHTTKIP